jgi:hypothetical protein
MRTSTCSKRLPSLKRWDLQRSYLPRSTLQIVWELKLPIGKLQTLSIQGEAELLEPIWPYAMEPLDLSLADPA